MQLVFLQTNKYSGIPLLRPPWQSGMRGSKAGWSLNFSVETYPKMSSHATCQETFSQSSKPAEPLWTDPGIKSGISVHKLICTYAKKEKEVQAGIEWLNLFPKSSQARKKPPPPPLNLIRGSLTRKYEWKGFWENGLKRGLGGFSSGNSTVQP